MCTLDLALMPCFWRSAMSSRMALRRPPFSVNRWSMKTHGVPQCVSRYAYPSGRFFHGYGQWLSVDPVSWLSRKVTAREGHSPMTPGGLPSLSASRQYSQRPTASCKIPLVVKSKAEDMPPVLSHQSTVCCLWLSWEYFSTPSVYSQQSQYSPSAKAGLVASMYCLAKWPGQPRTKSKRQPSKPMSLRRKLSHSMMSFRTNSWL
mmetsp:Transcript_5541/g.14943  ORF Transcript_5541/g.14943 Transcript_5541/m.14943 type:complete len:204 (+) Transcript_5541:791-1402(+)